MKKLLLSLSLITFTAQAMDVVDETSPLISTESPSYGVDLEAQDQPDLVLYFDPKFTLKKAFKNLLKNFDSNDSFDSWEKNEGKSIPTNTSERNTLKGIFNLCKNSGSDIKDCGLDSYRDSDAVIFIIPLQSSSRDECNEKLREQNLLRLGIKSPIEIYKIIEKKASEHYPKLQRRANYARTLAITSSIGVLLAAVQFAVITGIL